MRIVALKIDDRNGKRMVTAWGSRGKNRTILWREDMAGLTNKEIAARVEQLEQKRLSPVKE